MAPGAGSDSRSRSRDGRSTRWDSHRRERRAAIVDAAIAAIEEFGPEALTAQIADKAAVPRTHVYRHFDGKPALDLAVSRHAAGQVSDSIRAGPATGSARAVIRGAIDQYLCWVRAHPNLYCFLAQHAYAAARSGSPAADDARAAFARELTTRLARYLPMFDSHAKRTDRLIIGVVGMVDSTAAWWLEHPDIPRADLTAQLSEQGWLIIDHTTRELGLALDPDAKLPAQ